jgi:hypothetical protein
MFLLAAPKPLAAPEKLSPSPWREGIDSPASSTIGADPDFPALVGRVGWARLAPAIRRRFAPGHADASVTYAGRMRLERSLAGVLFALAAKLVGGPLPLTAAPDAEAEVKVESDGRGGVVWTRRLRTTGGGPTLVVRSTKRRDAAGRLLECVDGGLGMALDVFEEDAALVFQSRSYFLRILGVRLPIPAIATPGVCRVVHMDLGAEKFRFTLSFIHPVWGRTFVQDGVFIDPHPEE